MEPEDLRAEQFLRSYIGTDERLLGVTRGPELPASFPPALVAVMRETELDRCFIRAGFELVSEPATDEFAQLALTEYGDMIPFTDAIVTDPLESFYQDTRLFNDVPVRPDIDKYLDILAEFGIEDPRDADAQAKEAAAGQKEEFVRMCEKFTR
jgi:hypothetical protein